MTFCFALFEQDAGVFLQLAANDTVAGIFGWHGEHHVSVLRPSAAAVLLLVLADVAFTTHGFMGPVVMVPPPHHTESIPYLYPTHNPNEPP